MQYSPEVFKVLMTCGAFEPGFRRGGPIKSAAHIVDTVSDSVRLRLVVSDRDQGCETPYPGLSGRWVRRVRSNVFYLNHRDWRHWRRLLKDLRADHYDLIYLNSFWETVFTLVPALAARCGLIKARMILLAPRGELSPGAVALKSLKKGLYLRCFGPLLRSMNVVWHASTEIEAGQIRDRLPWAKVYVNANQAAFPMEPITPQPALHPHLRLIFLSRINPVKNLRALLRALPEIEDRLDLDIYGPIYDAPYWKSCEEIIRTLAPHVKVRYLGEVQPDQVRTTFAKYDAFVLPTRGENFGHVIAESLSAACPVICPDTTPWTPVLRGGGGVVLEDSRPRAIEREVRKMAAATPSTRLDARIKAAQAYRVWYADSDRLNIIETIRQEVQEQYRHT